MNLNILKGFSFVKISPIIPFELSNSFEMFLNSFSTDLKAISTIFFLQIKTFALFTKELLID